MDAIKAKARAKLSDDVDLSISEAQSKGPLKTALRTRTPEICDLIIDNVKSANVKDAEGNKFSLQVQPYRGGGTTVYFLSRCGTHAEKTDILKKALQSCYKDYAFRLRRCVEGDLALDSFFMYFEKSPRQLVKEPPLTDDRKALMVPILPGKRCPNPHCQWDDDHIATECTALSGFL